MAPGKAPGARARAKDEGDEFTLALEAASRGIRNPVAKLKYIRGSLARYEAVRRSIEVVPGLRCGCCSTAG